MSVTGPADSPTYFISDLHLDTQRPDELQLALRFFEQVRSAQSLFILGDLFEYWVGDDAGLAMYRSVVDALAAVSSSGCRITVMLGNRDFLLGSEFSSAVGGRLVREDTLLSGPAHDPVLLMHGDTLCTDDSDYQRFRVQVRDENWQQQFLSQSIDERVRYAEHLRDQSRQQSADKTSELMDVNAEQVKSAMTEHGCRTLIHGHTHRPDVHIDAATGSKRFVLGDWHADHARYAVQDANGIHMQTFTGQLCTPAPSA